MKIYTQGETESEPATGFPLNKVLSWTRYKQHQTRVILRDNVSLIVEKTFAQFCDLMESEE